MMGLEFIDVNEGAMNLNLPLMRMLLYYFPSYLGRLINFSEMDLQI